MMISMALKSPALCDLTFLMKHIPESIVVGVRSIIFGAS